MKFHEPRNLAILNAFIISAAYILLFLASVGLIFSHAFIHYFTYLALAVSTAAIFILVYFIFRYTLDRFIYSKIRLIYKSIHLVKTGKKEKMPLQKGFNLIDQVQAEVENWESDKEQELEQLKRLEQYRREFIGNLAHEMKTPTFNVQGYVSTLLDGAMDDPSVNRDYLKRADKSIKRMIKILEGLDEISQLESGQLKLKVTRFDLAALAKEVCEFLEMKSEKHGIRLCITNPEKPVMVEGDHELIRAVLINIIDNSIRYGTQDGGRTKVTFFDMDENILTEITDNGIGIDSADLARVFERFYRTERGREATRKGKGLGLAIVKHIIEAHSQSVSVRSTVGVGTTFGFTLKKS